MSSNSFHFTRVVQLDADYVKERTPVREFQLVQRVRISKMFKPYADVEVVETPFFPLVKFAASSISPSVGASPNKNRDTASAA